MKNKNPFDFLAKSKKVEHVFSLDEEKEREILNSVKILEVESIPELFDMALHFARMYAMILETGCELVVVDKDVKVLKRGEEVALLGNEKNLVFVGDKIDRAMNMTNKVREALQLKTPQDPTEGFEA